MDTKQLEQEVAWLRHELSLVPASRRRMMGRTVLASFERDQYKQLCEQVAPHEVAQIQKTVEQYARLNGLGYVLDKQL
ncbi:hypothetical protein EBT31_18665 [bacterium]|nr:hypothetical protein [bacterium]